MNASKLNADLGSTQLRTAKMERVSSALLIIHDKWRASRPHFYDIGLIVTKTDIGFDNTIKKAEIFESQYIPHGPFKIAGHGDSLQWSTLSCPKEQPDCAVQRSSSRPLLYADDFWVVSCPRELPSMICAQSKGGKSICAGDGGSGLALHNGTIVGIATYQAGQKCDDTNSIGYFTNVMEYNSWIQFFLNQFE